MARRSHRQISTLYVSHQSRSTTLADGSGFLYAFVDRGHSWKIGMSNNFARRKREWDRQCPSSSRRWMPPIRVKRRRRAGNFTISGSSLTRTLVHRSTPRLLFSMPQESCRDLHIFRQKVVCVEQYHLSSAGNSFEGVRSQDRRLDHLFSSSLGITQSPKRFRIPFNLSNWMRYKSPKRYQRHTHVRLSSRMDYLEGMGMGVIYVAGTGFLNEFGKQMIRTGVLGTTDLRGMYFMADFTVGTMSDLIGFKGFLNTTAPFTLAEYEAEYLNPSYGIPWNFTDYRDFEISNTRNITCVLPQFWNNGTLLANVSSQAPLPGCLESDFDQDRSIGAFGHCVFPDWQRQLSKFAGVQDRLREWKPGMIDKLTKFSCMVIQALDIDAIRVDKSLQITVDALTEYSQVVTNGQSNNEKYLAFSPVLISATPCMAYASSFGAFSAALVLMVPSRYHSRRSRSNIIEGGSLVMVYQHTFSVSVPWILPFITVHLLPTGFPIWAAAYAFCISAITLVAMSFPSVLWKPT
ncbi:hypothetical protein F5880DRAFT_1682578 [Lentinula raphanica]|nr:hypothetical protein F5880DRAFT_1682578 [Lentinula raphanica]